MEECEKKYLAKLKIYVGCKVLLCESELHTQYVLERCFMGLNVYYYALKSYTPLYHLTSQHWLLANTTEPTPNPDRLRRVVVEVIILVVVV